MLNIKAWLESATADLEQARISTARLDALVLLEDAALKERGWLLAHPEFEVSDKLIEKLNARIKRRAAHEPLAYIRKKTEFYGREFYVDNRVLEPRPESETMIELLKSLGLPVESTIIDIGTGSGALAITAKLELSNMKVVATDIDLGCIEVAKQNSQKFKIDIQFLEGDLLKPLAHLQTKTFVLLCNLPYVPDGYHINPAAMKEPRVAIFGGPDGLDLYRKLFVEVKRFEVKPKFILTESMPPQHDTLAKIAESTDYHLIRANDFIQVFSL